MFIVCLLVNVIVFVIVELYTCEMYTQLYTVITSNFINITFVIFNIIRNNCV